MMSDIKMTTQSAALVNTGEWATELGNETNMNGFANMLFARIKKAIGTRLSGRSASLEMTTP